ncbi:transposase [Streptomyces collinus]|uniref:transposase n=1 Tax=Streptomyces collinus TaxID=42684 RepID=UPI00368A4378
MNGIVYKIRTGILWCNLPARYGSWPTVYTRFGRYALDGVFTRALEQIKAHADAVGDVDWLILRPSKNWASRPVFISLYEWCSGCVVDVRARGNSRSRRRRLSCFF